MKKIIFLFLFIALTSSHSPLLAQGRGTESQDRNQDQQRVETQVRITQTENEEDSEDETNQDQVREQTKVVNSRSQTAREHMSVVSQTVEELLTADEVTGGIGQQVREIAQQQKQSQEETEAELEEIDSRPGWLTRLVGPDYKALKNINQQIEKNQLRIKQLEQLMTQAQNQADEIQLQETIEVLNQQNTTLQERVRVEEEARDLFGWLARLFSRYPKRLDTK